MSTECNQFVFGFHPQKRREIRAQFDGGAITSDGGGLLLREIEKRIGILRQFAACFTDYRNPDLIEHPVKELVAQRVYGLALGYEDLNDHDGLRNDPKLAVLVEKEDSDKEALAGKSTLNRLELTKETASRKERYKKIVLDHAAVDHLLVEVFLQAHQEAPEEIILDLDATDDPLHGQQEGRFFHGYGACPRAGEAGPGGHLLLSAALRVLRPASAGGQIAPGQYRCQRRQHRRGGADCRPHPPALAAGAHFAARRFGLCSRGADGLVREQWRRFPVWPGQEQPARRGDRGRTGPSRRAE